MNRYLICGLGIIAILITVVLAFTCLVFAFRTEPNATLAVIVAVTLLTMDAMLIDYLNRVGCDE